MSANQEHPVVALVRSQTTDPQQPFAIVAYLQLKPGMADAFREAVRNTRCLDLTRAEEGCVAYDLSCAIDDPEHVVVVEHWLNLAGLQAHVAQPHFQAIGAATADLLMKPPAVHVLIPPHAS